MLIETFADLICPWCYIGRHRLGLALAERPALVAHIRWQPFQLNPDIPAGGMDREAYLVAKFGAIDRARQIHAVVEDTAARDGLALDLARVTRTPNTFDAHRLIRIADHFGRSDAMTEALFRAYFTQGLDIGDRDTLIALAGEVGLEPQAIATLLAEGAEASAIKAADALARQLCLQAVPCYIFNRRFALAGAQDPLSFLPLLDLGLDDDTSFAAD